MRWSGIEGVLTIFTLMMLVPLALIVGVNEVSRFRNRRRRKR